jgi:hypothetical protein
MTGPTSWRQSIGQSIEPGPESGAPSEGGVEGEQTEVVGERHAALRLREHQDSRARSMENQTAGPATLHFDDYGREYTARYDSAEEALRAAVWLITTGGRGEPTKIVLEGGAEISAAEIREEARRRQRPG